MSCDIHALANVANLPRIYGDVLAQGRLRSEPSDFIVEELPSVVPDGEGEHLWLKIRKTSLNTADVVQRLSAWSGVSQRDIGFAGLKDRNAVTTQWFSVQLPGQQDPNHESIVGEQLEVLETARHRQKLRRGVLLGNRFTLTVHEFSANPDNVQKRLESIAKHGVPNYFGEQRFGRGGRNIDQAIRWLVDGGRPPKRSQKGMLLSAARSGIFNALLAERIAKSGVGSGSWAEPCASDKVMLGLRGNASFDASDEEPARLLERVNSGDVFTALPLAGRFGARGVSSEYADKLCRLIHGELVDGLAKAGVDGAWRRVHLPVNNFSYQYDGNALIVNFDLPAGSYATSVLREICASS